MTIDPTSHFPPRITERYEIIKKLGEGAYGYVCSARNRETGKEVAIKKISKIFDREVFAKRALREIKLLKHFSGHENMTSVLDMDLEDPMNFNEVYLVQDLMEADLHAIIRSKQPLSDQHYQFFIYQICRGLKYIHSAQVLHRDLKPGNLLVNADCELKICDFGLARGVLQSPEQNGGFLTEYVATRWYRAPEVMLSFRSYSKAIDMWSVGCILAELLGEQPLFRGKDYVDQLNQILSICGTPDDQTLARIGSDRAVMYIRSLNFMPKVPFATLFPDANPQAVDLLEKLLQFDPELRLSAEEALMHPYLEAYRDPAEEPLHPSTFDFSFESIDSIQGIRALIAQEVLQYRATHHHGCKNGQLRVNPVGTQAGFTAMEEVIDAPMDVDEELRMRGH